MFMMEFIVIKLRAFRSAINKFHHRFLSEYVMKTIFLESNILSKMIMVYQCLKQALQCTLCNFTKNEVHIIPFWRSAGNKDVSRGKSSWCKFFFSKVAESNPAVLSKMNSITEIFQQGFCKIALFKVSEYFLRNISVIPFLRKCKTPAYRWQLYWKRFVWNI